MCALRHTYPISVEAISVVAELKKGSIKEETLTGEVGDHRSRR
jgi:hypothetical protein